MARPDHRSRVGVRVERSGNFQIRSTAFCTFEPAGNVVVGWAVSNRPVQIEVGASVPLAGKSKATFSYKTHPYLGGTIKFGLSIAPR